MSNKDKERLPSRSYQVGGLKKWGIMEGMGRVHLNYYFDAIHPLLSFQNKGEGTPSLLEICYQYFSIMMYIFCHCVARCFYLSRCNPSGFKCLKSISTETNVITSIKYSVHSSFILFTKSGSLGLLSMDGTYYLFTLFASYYVFHFLLEMLRRLSDMLY